MGRGGGNKTNKLKVQRHNELLHVYGSGQGTAAVLLPGDVSGDVSRNLDEFNLHTKTVKCASDWTFIPRTEE